MKKFMYSVAACALLFEGTSCSSDDDNNSSGTPTQITNTITSGTWRITNFMEDDVDETSNFTGYNFTFTDANTVTATNGTNTYNGIWSVDDDDSSDDIDFDLVFTTPDDFTELSEDWDILSRTSSKLRLKHVSGGDGSVDYLTFEKNTN